MADEQIFGRVGLVIDRNGTVIAGVISAFGLVYFPTFFYWLWNSSTERWLSVVGLLLVTITAGAQTYLLLEGAKLARANERLSSENDLLNEILLGFGSDYSALWDDRLRSIARTLQMDGRDRVSVYRLDDDKFVLAGRYCEIPMLQQRGRAVYPSNQGVIGGALTSSDGACCVVDLPDPNQDLAGYKTANAHDWNVPAGVVSKLRMRARSIYAFALKHPGTKMRNGVIVFESFDPARFDVSALQAVVDGPAGDDLMRQLELLRKHGPSLEFAKTKGF